MHSSLSPPERVVGFCAQTQLPLQRIASASPGQGFVSFWFVEGQMAQNKIVRHHTIGTGLWLFVLAASMAGWVLALVWVAYLLMALDGSQ